MTRDYKYRDWTTTELLSLEASLDYHDFDLAAEICDRAGLLEEWDNADGETFESVDGETFESVLDRAIEILKEDI